MSFSVSQQHRRTTWPAQYDSVAVTVALAVASPVCCGCRLAHAKYDNMPPERIRVSQNRNATQCKQQKLLRQSQLWVSTPVAGHQR